jgi:hypothetical protein
MKARRFTGVAMMVIGPVLILASPWLVLSFEPIRQRVFDEGWALGATECVWFSELREAAVFGWFSGIVALGIVALFSGLWLFRTARFCRKSFDHDSLAV